MSNRRYKVEMVRVYYGYPCVVLKSTDTYMQHRCGYVGVDASHPLFGISYDEPHESVEYLPEDTVIGKCGPITLFIIHGSLTYSGSGDYPVESYGLWWFGFDCAHLGDREDPKSLVYTMTECEVLAKQLRELKTYEDSGAGPAGCRQRRKNNIKWGGRPKR